MSVHMGGGGLYRNVRPMEYTCNLFNMCECVWGWGVFGDHSLIRG